MKKSLILLLCTVVLMSFKNSQLPEGKLTKITIHSPQGFHLNIGQTAFLSVNGFDQANRAVALKSPLKWSTNNDNLTIDQNGKVTAIKAGTTTVSVHTEGFRAHYKMYVWKNGYKTEIYVSDAGNFNKGPYQIIKLDENGENPVVFNQDKVTWPQDIVFLEKKGIALISNLTARSIGRYDIKTGKFISNFATGIAGPTRMKIGADGLLYVLQWGGNGLVKRYKPDGTFVDDFTKMKVFQSIGMDWDKAGNLYVSSFNQGKGGFVHKFGPKGEDLGKFIDKNIQGATNIWFNEAGELFVNDYTAGVLKKFDATGKFLKGISSNIKKIEGFGLLKDKILIGCRNSVKMFDKNGQFIKDFYTSKKLLNANAVIIRYVAK